MNVWRNVLKTLGPNNYKMKQVTYFISNKIGDKIPNQISLITRNLIPDDATLIVNHKCSMPVNEIINNVFIIQMLIFCYEKSF